MRSRELLAMIDAAATLSPTRANGQECARPALIFYVATTVPADVDAFR
jgi:hypothetical protein